MYYNLKLSDILDDIDEAIEEERAYFGEKLIALHTRITEAYDEAKEKINDLEAKLTGAEKKLDGLKDIEKFVEDVMNGNPVEVVNGITGAKRSAKLGDIVMWTDLHRNDHVALVIETYGFPPGKVGLRVFGKTAPGDQYVCCVYSAERVYNTWHFID